MAITLPNGFIITNQQPVDSRMVLSKAEMLAAVDSRMPQVYACVCKDDGKLYIYNVDNSVDSFTGKFRKFEGGASYSAGTNIQISGDNVISATDTIYDDTEVKEDISSLQEGKLNKLPNVDDPSDPGYGWPYHFPYDVDVEANADGIELTLKTLTLDNNISKMNFTKTIPGATSATAGLMTANDKTALAGKQDQLTAGTNVQINNNVISATDTVYDDTDVKEDIASLQSGVESLESDIESLQEGKQSKLTAGTNVSIDVNNIISAIDTKIATSLTLGKAITAQASIGGIPAGKVYAATDTLAQLLEDLLGGSGPVPTGSKIYYSVGSVIPEDVSDMTAVTVDSETLATQGYAWKNITLNNEYAFFAIDKSIGLTCYEILQNGFALGFETVDLGDQYLYYPSDRGTATNVRLVYHFE